MKTEILLTMMEKLGQFGVILFIISLILFLVSTLSAAVGKVGPPPGDDGEWFLGSVKAMKYSAVFMAISIPFALVPSMDDIWKIRIHLLRLELTKTENVEQGIIEINRIAEKLECKYLGCEEKK